MPQSLANTLVHIVFSTKFRQEFIDKNIEAALFNHIGGTCKSLRCNTIIVGGYRNHVHIFCRLNRSITQAGLVKEIKVSSSKWIKTQGEKYQNFRWQVGYAIFSVSPSKVHSLKKYIKEQEQHHLQMNFEKEYINALEDHGIAYDEKYVWD